jgi:hypothetical protein
LSAAPAPASLATWCGADDRGVGIARHQTPRRQLRAARRRTRLAAIEPSLPTTRVAAIEPSLPTTRLAAGGCWNRGVPASRDDDRPGLPDLRAAVSLVASGTASRVILCGFPDAFEHLRAARALAIEGVVVEPLVRPGGGAFDIRVRRVTPPEA